MTGEDFKLLLRGKGIRQEDAAKGLGMSRQNLTVILGRAKVPDVVLHNAVAKLKISIPGYGPNEGDIPKDAPRSLGTIKKQTKETNAVTLYDNIVATGGKMDTLNDNENGRKIQLGDIFKDASGAMTVHGHSMYPDYENGCIVGFREIKDKGLIAYNEVYIIVTDEMCMIKKINKHLDPDFIIASSFNSSFEPFEIHREKIKFLYLVLGKISRAQMAKINFL